jgi:hypothetical protein
MSKPIVVTFSIVALLPPHPQKILQQGRKPSTSSIAYILKMAMRRAKIDRMHERAKMITEREDLIAWAVGQREEALRQVDLFSRAGVKAQLVMPDGTIQDITAGVLSHQKENVDTFARLVSALKA